MSIGPIVASGGLAVMIPPSALAVLLGAIGKISIGKLLMAIIFPGVLIAAFYAIYIIIRCKLQPSLAPAYEVPPSSQTEKLVGLLRNILPLGVIVFLVIGLIILGIATPTEAAASGALGTFALAAAYKRLNWAVVKKSLAGTITVTGMIFLIISGALAFSQVLAFTGASRGLVELATQLPNPIVTMVVIQVIVILMGCFMDAISIMMVTLPLAMPIIISLGLDPIWFGTIFLLNVEVGGITPPFGINLFVMKAVSPSDWTMSEIYRAAVPFIALQLAAMALFIAFPAISLWLPNLI